jgi:ribonuclease HII
MRKPDYSLEHALRPCIVAGVDEVGRGPLAGPVVAAAVILDVTWIPDGLNDSKKVPLKQREALCAVLMDCAEVGFGEASVEEIDRLNILRASHLAMVRAVQALPRRPDHVLVDGNLIPRDFGWPATAVIRGDSLSQSIAAASIVAKIRRDRIMWDLAQHYPGYGWETNMGYPSKSHRLALQNLGVTPHHRRSFKPVHNILYQD